MYEEKISTSRITSKYQATIPRPVRESLGVSAGDSIAFVVEGELTAHSVMAMITSASNPSWPLDVSIVDLKAAGLPQPSVVRMKLFTLDHRLVQRIAVRLAPADAAQVEQALRGTLGAGEGCG